MAQLPIVKEGNPVLRRKAKAVDKITPEIKVLIQDMFETMYKAAGIGLAAVQVGVSKQVITVDVSENKNQPIALINPRVVSGSGEVQSREGCLSVPGIEGVTRRKETVIVKGRNIHGAPVTLEAKGMLAICLQHEIDHLNGVLFIDKLIPELKND